MEKAEAVKQAIARIKGQDVPKGAIVATEDEPRTRRFDGYDRPDALLSIGGERWRVKRTEIFDVKKAINVANHLINLGFWNEGMESRIVTIAAK